MELIDQEDLPERFRDEQKPRRLILMTFWELLFIGMLSMLVGALAVRL